MDFYYEILCGLVVFVFIVAGIVTTKKQGENKKCFICQFLKNFWIVGGGICSVLLVLCGLYCVFDSFLGLF